LRAYLTILFIELFQVRSESSLGGLDDQSGSMVDAFTNQYVLDGLMTVEHFCDLKTAFYTTGYQELLMDQS
jgi:hypothetical protein